MKRHLVAFVGLICVSLFVAATWMDEGMWLLDSVQKLPLSSMRNHGLELTPDQIYSDTGTSLKDAIVLLPGGTGTFISNEGLILTNHHIAFGGIQSLSSVQEDYLKDGFLAKSKGEELSTSYTAEMVASMKDVTVDVLAVVSDTMSEEERTAAIKKKTSEIEAEAKAQTDLRCRVSELYVGVKYYLFMYETLSDVRLVFAPPSSIGNFGGEVDNWTWPRHTGDFALMRAYTGPDGKPAKYAKENIPYTPKIFLPISSKGAEDGRFAMIMGFPGRTFRYREHPAVKLAHDESLPLLIDLYRTGVEITEGIGKADREVEIKYAAKIRSVANAFKNYIGTLEGMRRSDFLNLKKNQSEEFAAFIAGSHELTAKYGTLLADMQNTTDEYAKVNRKNLVMSNLTRVVEALGIANRFIQYAKNPPQDSLGKTLSPTEKERGPLRASIASIFKNYDVRVDREVMVALILKSLEMPPEHQINEFRDEFGKTSGDERVNKVREFVTELYEDSRLVSREECEKLLMEDADDILDDPFAVLARELSKEQDPITAAVNKYNTAIGPLRRKYVEAWLQWKHADLTYPDANRTLRFTYGLVEPLQPRDAVHLSQFTTLKGVMEKETGEVPFVVPAKLKELWKKKDFGPYADPKRGDVPVAFIANLDITGGNSGSSVINGRGEVIGSSFDGNWESVVADYHFQHEFNRAINVDSRYMLFIIDKFAGADNIMKELVIK
ncbi:MAG: S46 family peptidase [Bacteroidota bacterium]